MQLDDLTCAIALSLMSSPGRSNLWTLIRGHGPRMILDSIRASGMQPVQAHIARHYPGSVHDAAERVRDAAARTDTKVVSYWDDEYPTLLREIYRPPLVLYVRGSPDVADAVAIVGTRDADPASAAITRRLASDLSAAGLTVVSGMAVGIDREAHLGVLQAGRATVGVLANGIDIHYPRRNTDIYLAMLSAARCGLVSEYPPGVMADRWTFVRRNRIISGLSRGVVVVKAGERSGALITAGYAVEQNRDVFACPGLAFDNAYAGCHRLIRNGALLVGGSGDILAEFHIDSGRDPQLVHVNSFRGDDASAGDTGGTDGDAGPAHELSDAERMVIELVTRGMCDIDQVIRRSGFATSRVTEALIMLEMSGYIARNGTRIVLIQK